jgi:hypothetical protein
MFYYLQRLRGAKFNLEYNLTDCRTWWWDDAGRRKRGMQFLKVYIYCFEDDMYGISQWYYVSYTYSLGFRLRPAQVVRVATGVSGDTGDESLTALRSVTNDLLPPSGV